MGETSLSTGTIIYLDDKAARPRSYWRDVLSYLARDRLTILALSVLLALTLACLLGSPLVENVFKIDPNRTNALDQWMPPGEEHLLGADQLGRDQLIRLLVGGRISLAVAYSASLMSIAIGMTIGMIAGYYGGRIDDIVIWFVNTLSSIPTIFLFILASATFQSITPEALIVLLALLSWIGTCRLVRGQVLSLKERDYILAAHALGLPSWRVMFYHILPNVLPIIITNLTISAGTLILIESGLSYLGLGIVPPTPSWGNMLTDARSYFARGAHLVFWPGLMITLTVLCFYLVGDGLRDALDPRTARR
jgi:peptide/nickel transport system permease protein